MKRNREKKSVSLVKRRAQLKRKATSLYRQISLAAEAKAGIAAVYREMSNLKPDAFVVVCRDDDVAVHGLSHGVSRGIETDGFEFYLCAALDKIGGTAYLIFGAETKDEDGMRVSLLPGEKAEVDLPCGDIATSFTIFFETNRKRALAFAREERAKRA
jgi:hypothetical protein